MTLFYAQQIDVAGLYLNIPHEEGLIAVRKALDIRKDETISTDPLIQLAGCILKNNVFEYDNSIFKQLRGTATGTEMMTTYAIIIMDFLEEETLEQQPFEAFSLVALH